MSLSVFDDAKLRDLIHQEVRTHLHAVDLHWGMNDRLWTQAILSAFRHAGEQRGYRVRHEHSWATSAVRKAHTVDLAWLHPAPNNGLALALESEMNARSDILRDFNKLVRAPAPVKVMLYCVSKQRDEPFSVVVDRLTESASKMLGFIKAANDGASYVLIGFAANPDELQGHWASEHMHIRLIRGGTETHAETGHVNNAVACTCTKKRSAEGSLASPDPSERFLAHARRVWEAYIAGQPVGKLIPDDGRVFGSWCGRPYLELRTNRKQGPNIWLAIDDSRRVLCGIYAQQPAVAGQVAKALANGINAAAAPPIPHPVLLQRGPNTCPEFVLLDRGQWEEVGANFVKGVCHAAVHEFVGLTEVTADSASKG